MSRRVLQGVVVGDACDKTVIVKVERRVIHPVYKKIITHSKKYAAHDQDNRWHIGDAVRIEESRPISKRKHWVVLGATEDGAGGRRRGAAVDQVEVGAEAGVAAEKPTAGAA